MECVSHDLSMAYFTEFLHKASNAGVPLSGSIEVTKRCNLRCVHCYVGVDRSPRNDSRPEMKKGKVHSLLDELGEAGCLMLLITGGEPLMRPDFIDIYEHAKRLGMLITIFTNGTLISDQHLDLFADLPPLSAEISLYGATEETYERVTHVPGSFRKCLSAIESLLKIGVSLKLKTMLLSLNLHEFFRIEEMANDYGVPFRFDACLFPGFDGSRQSLALRVPPEEAVRLEFAREKRALQLQEYYARQRSVQKTDSLYICGAGTRNFHIDAGGYLMPCLMVRDFRYDLISGAFMEGWPTMAGIKGRKGLSESPCFQCKAISLCGYCPAFFRLEKGDEKVSSEYLCTMGKTRYAALKQSEVIEEVCYGAE